MSEEEGFSVLIKPLRRVVTTPSETPLDPRKLGRPPVPTSRFALRITSGRWRKLAGVTAKEQEARDGRNVTPQQIAVRILEAHFAQKSS
jgi:hypothetical protein